jgi:hypothetical protein
METIFECTGVCRADQTTSITPLHTAAIDYRAWISILKNTVLIPNLATSGSISKVRFVTNHRTRKHETSKTYYTFSLLLAFQNKDNEVLAPIVSLHHHL